MTIPIVVVGAGGFGRESLDVIEAINRAEVRPVYEILGVLDPRPAEVNLERLQARGIHYLGNDEEWLAGSPDAQFVVGIGSPAARRSVDSKYRAAGLTAATIVHPSARIGSRVVLGPGAVVCGGARLSTNVQLGRQVHINPHASIAHDGVLEDFVSINPAAIISGRVRVRAGTLVGASAVVLEGRTVGEGCVIGAAACVTRDVLPGVIVKGIPAR